MGLELILIIIQACVSQVIASYAPYVQYAGPQYPIPAYVTSYPVQNLAQPTPVYAQPYPQPASNYQPTTSSQPYKPATPGTSATYQPVPTFSPSPISNAITSPIYQPTAYQATSVQQPIKTATVASAPDPPKPPPIIPAPSVTKDNSSKSSSLPKDLLATSPPFDTNILNNLAIALQLLIVSNLIHNPPPESNSRPIIDEDIFPEIEPLPIAYIPPSFPEPSFSNHIPNANFLGTSSFADTGISKSMMGGYGSPTMPAPRPLGLMSPYDAIGPNSPFIDSFQPKPEPKSPYHLTSDYKDLFSLTELFRI